MQPLPKNKVAVSLTDLGVAFRSAKNCSTKKEDMDLFEEISLAAALHPSSYAPSSAPV